MATVQKSDSVLARPIYLKVGFFLFHIASLREASEKYCTGRDQLGEGASKTPTASVVYEDGEEVGRISYNGRIWPPGEYVPNVTRPIYDNAAA